MRPQNEKELWFIVNQRIMLFNRQTGEDVPNIYEIPQNPTPKGMMRMRHDLDSLAKEYEIFKENEQVKSGYLAVRERIEAIRDIAKAYN